jgi:DNA-binding response OmpR family regulator
MAKRILVIDDDKDILEILNIIFQEEGYNVITSNNADAINRIQIIHPNLILLDVRIAGSEKSGAQICSQIKSQYASEKLPVILISAESGIQQMAQECNADAYVQKPFDIFQLLVKVKELIN